VDWAWTWPTKLVDTVASLDGDRKTNFRSFIYRHSSTNPANSEMIGLKDVEIIGLTESLKINTKQRQNMNSPSAAQTARAG